MSEISSEAMNWALHLLPGLLCAWVVFNLTKRKPPTQFERVVQAVIYSFLINGTVELTKFLLLFIGEIFPNLTLGSWSTSTTTIYSTLYALFLGALISFGLQKDIILKWLRDKKITNKSSHLNNWEHAFDLYACYVTLHLHDERRIMGYPIIWPSIPSEDHILLGDCSWLVEGAEPMPQEIPLSGPILINASDVKWVEFLSVDQIEDQDDQ